MKKLELYIHIPFCVAKCAYCDFYSMPVDNDTKSDYVDAVIKQINRESPSHSHYIVSSIYFGGGTPSSVEPELLMKIIDNIRMKYNLAEDCEITVECNPGTVTKYGLRCYREHGVNRLSFGLQSANDSELRMLGRIHNFSDFCDSYQKARMEGFDNINIDLISSIPGQHAADFKKTLQTVAMLKPEHISAYSLILEEGTPLYERYAAGEDLKLPNEEEERVIYHMTAEVLAKYGYRQYEISNYSKPGYECRHNIGYWDRTEYFGYGVSAASLMGNRRFSVIKDIKAYIKSPLNCYTEEDILTEQDAMAEFMYLGLRMNRGVSIADFKNRFGRHIENVYGDVLQRYCGSGHLLVAEDRIMLSESGRDVSNYIFADFI